MEAAARHIRVARSSGSGRRSSSPAWPCSRFAYVGHVAAEGGSRGCTRPGSTRGWSCSRRSAASRALPSSAPSAPPGSSSAPPCSRRRAATSSSTSGTAGIRPSRPPPTLAYLAFYPLLYVGIVLLLRRRVSTFSASLWLDGLMAATAAAALAASVLVEVVVNSTHGSRLVVVTNLAYPIGDVLLLALIVFVFSVTRWQPGRAWTLDRRRTPPQHGGRRRLPLPDRGRHLRRGDVPRPRLAALARPRRARGLAAPWTRPACPAAGSRAARHADRVRPDRDGGARRRVSAHRAPARARPRQRDDRARPGADGAQLLGERRSCSRPAATRR